jgi:hypothetical protein
VHAYTKVEVDEEMKAIMEEQAKTEYQAMAKEWVTTKTYYKQNQSVMCGLIMKRCNNSSVRDLKSEQVMVDAKATVIPSDDKGRVCGNQGK